MARKNGACNVDTRVKDTIAELHEHGITPKKIAELTRQSRSLVGFVVRSAKLAKKGDIEGLRKLYHEQNQKCNVRWACDKYGIDLAPIEEPEPEKEEEPILPDPDEATPIIPFDRTESATLQDIEDAIHVAQKKMDLNMDARFTELMKKLDKLSVIIQSCCKGIECKIESVVDRQGDEDEETDGHENWY